jgi:hypothetical protein
VRESGVERKEIVAKRLVEVYKRSVLSERAEASGAGELGGEMGGEMRLADRTWQFKLIESTRWRVVEEGSPGRDE